LLDKVEQIVYFHLVTLPLDCLAQVFLTVRTVGDQRPGTGALRFFDTPVGGPPGKVRVPVS
jgi:hypothetical protein